jgi:hypothetical protein
VSTPSVEEIIKRLDRRCAEPLDEYPFEYAKISPREWAILRDVIDRRVES